VTRPVRRFIAILGVAAGLAAISPSAALAQVSIDPTATPVKNTGGWVYNMAQLMTLLGVLILILIVLAYMRYAPRFQRDESLRTTRAEPVRPGREPPRRAVDVSQAVPLVVAPPAVPSAASVAPAAPAPAATAPAPAATAPAPAATAPAAPAPAPAPPAAAQTVAAPAAEAPAAAEPAQAPAASAQAAPVAPSAAEHKEVSLDQETFDRVLAELLEKGTDRRVAEGQARRAAMIAARKKAGG
jgi:uncharacterized membrane protein